MSQNNKEFRIGAKAMFNCLLTLADRNTKHKGTIESFAEIAYDECDEHAYSEWKNINNLIIENAMLKEEIALCQIIEECFLEQNLEEVDSILKNIDHSTFLLRVTFRAKNRLKEWDSLFLRTKNHLIDENDDYNHILRGLSIG